MALYLIGDIQGCDTALQRLLDRMNFSPSRDTLYVLGDLVNRGPESAAVLRRMMGYGASAQCILGNHDLHLLAVAYGARPLHRKDTLDGILQASDRKAMIDWLRQQPLARPIHLGESSMLLVHAGVLPSWTVEKTLLLAQEIQALLQSPRVDAFLRDMYGNQPSRWNDTLVDADRWRVIVNALTRMRFCSAQGDMEFDTTDGADAAPTGYMPWFEVPGRATLGTPVAFGHWSTLGWKERTNIFALDTGCVWGGALSALQLDASGNAARHVLIQVACEMAQRPGLPANKCS